MLQSKAWLLTLVVLVSFSTPLRSKVFLDQSDAEQLLRAARRPRANFFLEEVLPGNLERECYEEICSQEEAAEIFQSREKTMEFWYRYTNLDPCHYNPCLNGGICTVDRDVFLCLCPPQYEGKTCSVEVFECQYRNGGCLQYCENKEKREGVQCSCAEGYQLDTDEQSCSKTVSFPCGRKQNEAFYRSSRSLREQPQPTAMLDPQPTAVLDPQPTAVLDPQPTAVLDPQPTAVLDPQPTAVLDRQPTVVLDPQPTVVLDRQPTVVLDPQPTVVLDRQPTAVLDPQPTAVLDPQPTAVLDLERSTMLVLDSSDTSDTVEGNSIRLGVNMTSTWRGENETEAWEEEEEEEMEKEYNMDGIVVPRIVGGLLERQGGSPWQVLIRRKDGYGFCGGTLVSERWVVSAAHCFGETPDHVTIGDYDKRRPDPDEQQIKVERVVVHPHFHAYTFDSDIALVYLAQPVVLGPTAITACLPNTHLAKYLIKEETRGVVTGWGAMQYLGRSSRFLRRVSLPVVSRQKCVLSTEQVITDNMFCAGYLQANIDACSGDSGGPFVVSYRDTWYLTGVVSWGERCAAKGKYGVYTRLGNYLGWIRDTMDRQEQSNTRS